MYIAQIPGVVYIKYRPFAGVAPNCDIQIFYFPLIIYARCVFRRARATLDFISFEGDESFDVTMFRKLYRYTFSTSYRSRCQGESLYSRGRKQGKERDARYRLTSRFYRKQIISCDIHH